jgi:small subunit ribosomal protein S8
MAANDTIADMLTRIRNANLARHQTVDIPSTKMTRSIAQVLKEEGSLPTFRKRVKIRRSIVMTLNIVASPVTHHSRT